MKEDALDSPVTLDSGEILDLKEFLLKYVPGLAGIEETNKSESEGKWFFMVKKAKITAVTTFLDKHLKEIQTNWISLLKVIAINPHSDSGTDSTQLSY
eukprot:scaffold62392_cov58-Attheya_sp.AAC.1